MNRKGIVFILVVALLVYSIQGISEAAANKMYWTDYGTKKIQRANLDGTSVEDLVTTRFGYPFGLALDVAGGKMYWISNNTDKIQRANLDGTSVEDLVTTGFGAPHDLALDVSNGKMYWTDYGNDGIRRANLDGTDREYLVIPRISDPFGLALDVYNSKMYWAEGFTHTIRRANLDGTDSEYLVTGIRARSLALDVYNSKMYWTNRDTGKILRANLDGTDIEDLVTTGFGATSGLALDMSNSKMYWTNTYTGKILRANLDGTDIEDLVTGLVNPSRLALDVAGGIEHTTEPTDPATNVIPLVSAADLDLSHGGDVRCVAYSPSGVVLASSSTDNTIRLWRTTTGEHLNTLEKHTGDVNSIAFSPNDAYIASGGDDGRLRLWKWSPSADTWVSDQGFTIPGGALTNNVKSVAFSHDNTMLACGTSGNRIFVWDYDPEAQEWVYRQSLKGHSRTVNSVVFSPWGAVLASASDDDTVRLWHARTGEHFDTLDEHTADVNSVAFSRNDEFIASGSDDDTIILWQWSASADTWVFHKSLEEPDGDVRSVVFNPSGTVLLGGIADSTIGVWDAKTGVYRAFLKEHTDAVNSVAYNFQGNAIASGSDDGMVRQLPDTGSTDLVDKGMSLTLPPDLISEVALGPNSTYFILKAQFPTLTGFQDEPSYGKCTITLDIEGVPEDSVSITDRENSRLDAPGYFMYRLKSPRQQIADATTELVVESGVDIAAAGVDRIKGGAGIIISLSWNLNQYSGEVPHILQSTADPVLELEPSNFGEGTGRPTGSAAFIVLVRKRLESIDVKMEQEYVLKSERRQFWFDPVRTVTYKGTLPFTSGTLAAPSAQAIALADYPPFQLLPAKVQEYLLRHFGEFRTAREWQIPETTALLPNYPNPFNPETWIPYQLAKPADVTLTFYDIHGRVVRHLDLGHQRAGMYHTRSRAAYWDGRNAQGEPVASGVYFYTLKAGDFTATRKMLIRK